MRDGPGGDTKNSDESWLEQIALSDAIARLGQREAYTGPQVLRGVNQMEVSNEVESPAQVSRLEERHKPDKEFVKQKCSAFESWAFFKGCPTPGHKLNNAY